MNIMLVSVTERTSEIGLKKALGAKRRVIMAQFLTESAVLTSVGGILGIIVGIALAKLISTLTGLEFAVSIPWIFISVAFSMGIGILFGAMPASKASKLNPIEALRRD
jgi:putative ABC transport system permease protein